MTFGDVVRDEEFDCATVILQVEIVLFRVNRSIFSDSPAFEGMFNMPQPTDAPREGSSFDCPLKLPEGVRQDDFRNFLRVFLPIRSQFTEAPELSKDVWLSVLHLASMWDMGALREKAISQLTGLVVDAGEKIQLAERYDIPEWVLTALTDLVNRTPPIDEADVASLGLVRALKAVALREERFLFARRSEPSYYYDQDAHSCELQATRETDSLRSFARALPPSRVRAAFDL